MRKKALITGVNGQDGSYLAEFLLEKDYEVYGLIRRSSTDNRERVKEIIKNNIKTFHMEFGDVADSVNLVRLLKEIQPDEVYNLAAQSHVKVSFEVPEYTADVDAIGVLRILEAIRILELEKKTKFYQASTSELFGWVQEVPQKETTSFYPRSPYAVAKLYGYWIVKNYREAYQFFACNGILFNHESERRGDNFVTRKITLAVANIYHHQQDKLVLGNLDAKRDWGYAKDYVECMWLILQQEHPDDFVVATGETHTVREFVECSFNEVGIDIIWEGDGINEKGIDKSTGKVLVEVDPMFFRPAEVELLIGDPSKAKKELGWNPRKTPFRELVRIMMQYDLKRIEKQLLNLEVKNV